MRDRLFFFGFLAFFWMAFFIAGRGLFLTYHHFYTASLTGKEIATIMWLGLRMDAAMTGYWLLLPGLFLAFSAFLPNRIVYWCISILTSLLILISCIIIIADIELYKHWGFRINTTPLMYLETEAASSVNTSILILLLLLFGAILTVSCYVYWKKIAPRLLTLPSLAKRWSPVWIIITAALIIPIRSSFSVAPLNTGAVYFHKTKAFPNHAGINPVWNFFKSVSHDDSHRYPDNFYDGQDLQGDFSSLITTSDSTVHLLTVQKPNILLIILESFTAKVIEPLGGRPGITPELNALIHDGILFTNFYASGDRTDKGIVSILSSYPAQPRSSILKFPEKTEKLPSLPRVLNQAGYHTSFVYGGDIGFANMRSYITSAGFSHITDDDDFDSSIDNSKWGVADHFVFGRLIQECDSAQTPFFKTMLSLSSHEPFEVPMETVIEGMDEASLFLNSCYYTDKSLGDFIRQAKQQAWWKNTMVVITADHGHRFPDPKELKEKDRFKIPMLWLGGALNVRDTLITTLGSQTDIAKTILSQLDKKEHSEFTFGKNILARDAQPYAVYVFNNGYGYVSPAGEHVFDFDMRNFLKVSPRKEDMQLGKAYMQTLFTDYNNR